MRLVSLMIMLAACGSKSAPQPPPRGGLAITNVRVFDGTAVSPRATVVVDGDAISAVGPDVPVPVGAEVIDGRGKTLLPGLVDAHAHVYDGGQLEQALAFGVTTVLDMFSLPDAVKPLRADVPGRASLLSAGILATAPGGHGTEYGFEIPTIKKPEEAQAFVDARLAEGSNYIKIVFDNGSAYGIKIPTIDAATLRALVEAAHARKVMAVVHIGSEDEARTAIESGADGLVHLYRDRLPDPDFAKLVVTHHAFVTPTLAVLRTIMGKPSPLVDEPAFAAYLTHEDKANLVKQFPIRAKAPERVSELAIAQLRDAKVPILVGTDAPNPGTTYGATVHDELALLVAAGLTPVQALTGATSSAAERFSLGNRGRIRAQARADLLLVDGDPTTTITDTRKIVAVWHLGKRFDRDAYAKHVASIPKPSNVPAKGLASDFEKDLTPRYGQPWAESTDSLIGGTSKVKLAVKSGALEIAGTVVAHQPASWAGALWSPGTSMFGPIDLSANKGLRFRARGDGKASYVVMVFAASRGRMPLSRPFTPGKAFTEHRFAWADFDGIDGKDVAAILIAAVKPGAFALAIDDVTLE